MVPFLLNIIELPNPSLTPLQDQVIREYASALYAVNLSVLLAVLGLFLHILAKEEANLIAPELVARYRTVRNIFSWRSDLCFSLAHLSSEPS